MDYAKQKQLFPFIFYDGTNNEEVVSFSDLIREDVITGKPILREVFHSRHIAKDTYVLQNFKTNNNIELLTKEEFETQYEQI